jgi:hypothetical protein
MFDFNVTRRDSERLLLKHCYEGVVEEQERFAHLSYSHEIEFTIRRVLDGHRRGLRFQLPEEEIIALVTTCIFRVYEAWEHLPAIRHDLRVSVRKFAVAYVKAYLKAEISRPAVRHTEHG